MAALWPPQTAITTTRRQGGLDRRQAPLEDRRSGPVGATARAPVACGGLGLRPLRRSTSACAAGSRRSRRAAGCRQPVQLVERELHVAGEPGATARLSSTTGEGCMRRRILFVTMAFGIAGVALVVPVRIAGQAGQTYSPPRMPDGRPDLQGTYDLATLTPLERPSGMKLY